MVQLDSKTAKGARKVILNQAVVFAELNDEAILLNVETGIYYGLNPTGTQIWELLVEGLGEDEIIQRILADYEVDAAQASADVAEFLGFLTTRGVAVDADAELT
jgi:hypothetical protein